MQIVDTENEEKVYLRTSEDNKHLTDHDEYQIPKAEYKKNTLYLPKFVKPPTTLSHAGSLDKGHSGISSSAYINQPSGRPIQINARTAKNAAEMNAIKSEINKESDSNSFWSHKEHYDPKA